MNAGYVREPFVTTLKRSLLQFLPVYLAVTIGLDYWRGKAACSQTYIIDKSVDGLLCVLIFSLLMWSMGRRPRDDKAAGSGR